MDTPFDISIIQVYAPTSASTEEEIEDLYIWKTHMATRLYNALKVGNEQFRNALTESAQLVLPVVERTAKHKWMLHQFYRR